MGCASSKRIEAATVDVYRLPPTSFAVFDINSVEEPWLKGANNKVEDVHEAEEEEEEEEEKPAKPILDKLNSSIDDAPRSWDEVSKALEDIKPTLQNPPPPKSPKKPLLALPAPPPPDSKDAGGSPKRKIPRKSFSFHTLEELESNMSKKDKSKKPNEVKKSESMRNIEKFSDEKVKNSESSQVVLSEKVKNIVQRTQSEGGYKPVKENIFVLRDRMEREKEGKPTNFVKFDPLGDYQELCPPLGEDLLVVYTTSLGGVRRTFEDCNKVRLILESHRVVFDERDISLHGEFRNELKELLGEGEDATVPRLFVKGRYVGGVDEIVHLNETKRLGRILNWARVERGVGWLGCEGCGGARFVPCFDCGGSCKVVIGDNKERCPKCNENGLIHCPICH